MKTPKIQLPRYVPIHLNPSRGEISVCPTSKELGRSPAETLPVVKHAGIPRNVTAPKANAKSHCSCPRAGVTFGTYTRRNSPHMWCHGGHTGFCDQGQAVPVRLRSFRYKKLIWACVIFRFYALE